MKKTLVIILVSLIGFSFAQPQGSNPEIAAQMEPYFNLISSVGLMLELEKTSDLPVSAEQAALLAPILNELANSPGYSSERAAELLDTMELDILTSDQLIWMDTEFLRRQEAAQTGEEGGFFGGFGGTPPGGTPPNGPGGGFGGPPPEGAPEGGPGGRGGP
ncbi:MAG: hypothetical protein KC422_23655, partial [Trueperaceae bacterium]|nr:hypothetical protein [Trueperaceae bacterium]